VQCGTAARAGREPVKLQPRLQRGVLFNCSPTTAGHRPLASGQAPHRAEWRCARPAVSLAPAASFLTRSLTHAVRPTFEYRGLPSRTSSADMVVSRRRLRSTACLPGILLPGAERGDVDFWCGHHRAAAAAADVLQLLGGVLDAIRKAGNKRVRALVHAQGATRDTDLALDT